MGKRPRLPYCDYRWQEKPNNSLATQHPETKGPILPWFLDSWDQSWRIDTPSSAASSSSPMRPIETTFSWVGGRNEWNSRFRLSMHLQKHESECNLMNSWLERFYEVTKYDIPSKCRTNRQNVLFSRLLRRMVVFWNLNLIDAFQTLCEYNGSVNVLTLVQNGRMAETDTKRSFLLCSTMFRDQTIKTVQRRCLCNMRLSGHYTTKS